MSMTLPLRTIAAAAIFFSAATTAESGESGFIGYMTKLQYFSHKLGLAIDSGNKDLQNFYAHEVEEQIEALTAIEKLDDIAVSKLLAQFLVPKFEILEDAVKAGDPTAVNTAYDGMLQSCNDCHRASQRPYIEVERQTHNPYMQSFK